MKKAIVLLSGGLDSTTMLAIAKNLGFEIYALSFDYGQRHGKEIINASKIAKSYEVKEHKIIKIDLRTFGGSALTTGISIPKNRTEEIMSSEIPVTYVPARNTIFLSYALAWAEVINSLDIFIGVNSVDYSGYPDCRKEFIKAFENMANLATKQSVMGEKLNIHTPLINLHKSEIIKKGISLKVDYSLTHSCYDPDQEGRACGLCDSCILRKKGFKEAGLEDPVKHHE